MKINGERILIFGDSLTHHGDDNAPEIWDVDRNSSRISAQPGDLLASLLAEKGATVRTNANVSRSAVNFWNKSSKYQHTSAQDLISLDGLFAPTQVVVMLGTNDLGLNLRADTLAMQRIRDAYIALGARDIWAIGPPVFANAALNAQSDVVYQTLYNVFGVDHVIDARPLSTTTDRAGDGVHFQPSSARDFAQRLLFVLDKIGTQASVLPTPTTLPTPTIRLPVTNSVSLNTQKIHTVWIGIATTVGTGMLIYLTWKAVRRPKHSWSVDRSQIIKP